MADYRDPKVTTGSTKRDSGMGKWVGIAIAALAVLLLIAWWAGALGGGDTVEPEVVAPATEEPATGTVPPATETPAAPAQQ
jgi:hypothetical protein